jgi:hypothetical protein
MSTSSEGVAIMSKLGIPSVEEILKEAVQDLLKKYNKKSPKELFELKSFSDMVNEIEERAERLYRVYEKEAIKRYLQNKGLIAKDVVEAINKIIDNSLLTSIANTRRARAGLSSQHILAWFLKELGIPCQISQIKLEGYRPDITIPSDADIQMNMKKGIALAVKRTLRERWSEDIHVFKFPNAAFVLIKPDPDFTIAKAEDMANRGMKKVYIPDTLYEKYKDELEQRFKGIFRKLSDLPKDVKKFLKAR